MEKTRIAAYLDISMWAALIIAMWCFNSMALIKVIITMMVLYNLLQTYIINVIGKLLASSLKSTAKALGRINKTSESGLDFSSFGKDFE